MMLDPEDVPVTDDESEHERLKQRWHPLSDTHDFTEYVRSVGLAPPDGRAGWKIAYAWGPNGEDLGLVWSAPLDEPDEEDKDFDPDEEITLNDGRVVRLGDFPGP